MVSSTPQPPVLSMQSRQMVLGRRSVCRYKDVVQSMEIPSSCVRQVQQIDPLTKLSLELSTDNAPPFYARLQTASIGIMTTDLHAITLDRNEYQQFYRTFHHWKRRGFPEVIPSQVLLEFDSFVYTLMFHRLFFVAGTEPDCYMGVALSTIEGGDCVCVLAGGDTPYILRPRSKISDQNVTDVEEWEFIHDCYIHGVMYGEALQRLEDPRSGGRTLCSSDEYLQTSNLERHQSKMVCSQSSQGYRLA